MTGNSSPKNFRSFQQWIAQSIQRKLVFWSIGFWVISLTILSLFLVWVGQNEIINQTRQRNVQLASIIGRDINAQISGILSDLRVFSRRLEESNPDLVSQASEILSLRLSAPQRYQAVYYFDAEGDPVIQVTDPLPNLLSMKAEELISRQTSRPEQEVLYSYGMIKSINTYLSDVYFSSLDRTPVIYTGAVVKFSETDSRVVVLKLDLNDVWQRINLSTIGRSGFTYAASNKGIIIAHPDPALVGSRVPAEVQPVLEGYEGFTEYFDKTNQREVFGAFSPVGGLTGWGIVIEQDKAEAEAPLYRASILIAIVWSVLAILGTTSIVIIVRNFTKPLIQLTKTAQIIAETGDLTKSTTVKRPDEVGQMSHSFDQMIDRLQKSEGRLARAAIEERNRLARDLHDAVSQTLFSATLIAEVLPRIWDRNPPEGRKRLEEIRQLTRGALAEMRTLLLELRPTSLTEAEMGYLLRQLAESITGRSRIPVTLSIDGECSVPNEVKIALYRIAQEALNNVVKHAGAKEASVSLRCTPEQVELVVSDNGQGFDLQAASTKSLGLGIIRERTSEIGGSLSIRSEMGNGTQITVVWKTDARSSRQNQS